MKAKQFYLVSGAIFSAVALMHVLRLVYSWEVVIGGFMMPMWASYIGVLIAGYLAYSAFQVGRGK